MDQVSVRRCDDECKVRLGVGFPEGLDAGTVAHRHARVHPYFPSFDIAFGLSSQSINLLRRASHVEVIFLWL
jgi:hypothetical protein